MTPRIYVLLLAVWMVSSLSGLAQEPAASSAPDPRALLAQFLAAAGATNVNAFAASGTITYFWAGQPVQGAATLSGRGADQFRLDADLPGGTRSFALSHRTGMRKGADGKLAEIPVQNASAGSIPAIPYPSIAAALADPAVEFTYLGLEDAGGRQFYRIRVSPNIPAESDPRGIMKQLSWIDYLVDTRTYLVAKTADLTHPKETITESYLHEIELEEYTTMGGIAVPTIIREKVGGQTTWELRLSAVVFNPNLSDADFSLQ